MRVTQTLFSLMIALSVVAFVGCGSGDKKTADSNGAQSNTGGGDEHAEEHHHPETYDDAVAELNELTAAISKGFAEDDVEAAHGPLHQVGHILEVVENLAKGSDLADDAKKSIEDAVNDLFEAFTAVDDKQHGLEGKDYKDVSDDVDAQLKVLAEYVGKIEGTAHVEEKSDATEAPGDVPPVSEVTE